MLGIVDTAADVTIIGGEAFKKIAVVARLHKSSRRIRLRTTMTESLSALMQNLNYMFLFNED